MYAQLNPESRKLADFLTEYFGTKCGGLGTGYHQFSLTMYARSGDAAWISIDYQDRTMHVERCKPGLAPYPNSKVEVTNMDQLLEALTKILL
jgi:hypothetical protein